MGWPKGKPCPEEAKRKISQTLLGHKTPIAVRAKISKSLTGHKVLESTKRKLSISHKKLNQNPYYQHPLKGRKLTASHREKLRQANLGKKLSDERKKKISIAGQGRKHTEESKRKMSRAQKGKKLSLEHKRKLAEATRKSNLGRKHTEETKRKISRARLGQRLTSEVKRKISQAHLRRWQEPAFRETFAERMMKRPTRPERLLLDLLNKNFPGNFKYTGDGSFWLSIRDSNGDLRHLNPDFLNTNGAKLVIEMFGDYWHKNDNGEERRSLLKSIGFELLVVWEHELKEASKVVKQVKRFLQKGDVVCPRS